MKEEKCGPKNGKSMMLLDTKGGLNPIHSISSNVMMDLIGKNLNGGKRKKVSTLQARNLLK